MDTKTKIINVALKNFMSKGYDKTSLNDIVEECNVSKGAFYHHFKNKDELFLKVLTDMVKSIDNWTAEHVATQTNFRDFLRSYFDFPEYFRNWGSELKASVNMYRMVFDAMRIFPHLKKEFSDTYKKYFEYIAAIMKDAQNRGEIRTDINVGNLGIALVVLVEGFILFEALLEDEDVISSKTDSIADEIWNLIKS